MLHKHLSLHMLFFFNYYHCPLRAAGLLSRTRKESHVALKVLMDLLALACQLTGFVVWPIVEYGKNPDSWRIWLIPPAILLTSFGWWENYVDKHSKFSELPFINHSDNVAAPYRSRDRLAVLI